MSAHKSAPLSFALPSKGRLKEDCLALFERAGHRVEVEPRGYTARADGLDGLVITLMSAGEIAGRLASGTLDAGITGMDVLHEALGSLDNAGGDDPAPLASGVVRKLRLGFGPARLVVAVPNGWLDVGSMADLADVAAAFRRDHGRHLLVATKYVRLTRVFFQARGLSDYRIVHSSGATEAAPASGAADIIVDISTTGATLGANRLMIPADGEILKSEASLFFGSSAAHHAAPMLETLAANLKRVV